MKKSYESPSLTALAFEIESSVLGTSFAKPTTDAQGNPIWS